MLRRERDDDIRLRAEVHVRDCAAAPAGRVVKAETRGDPGVETRESVGAHEHGRCLLEEGRRQPRRAARELPGEVAPGGRDGEAALAEGGRRDGVVGERALHAARRPRRELVAERAPAAEARGTERLPGSGGMRVTALRQDRRARGEAVGGGDELRVDVGAEPLRSAVRRGAALAPHEVREPDGRHATRRPRAPARRWLAGSRGRR